jgi:transcription-repair coupling factor (superfamily II helicase)
MLLPFHLSRQKRGGGNAVAEVEQGAGLFALVENMPEIQSILDGLPREGLPVARKSEQVVFGLKGSARAFLICLLHRATGRPVVAVTSSWQEAESIKEDITPWMGSEGSLVFPPHEILPPGVKVGSPEITGMRLDVLQRLCDCSRKEERCRLPVLLCPVSALMRRLLPREAMIKKLVRLEVKSTLEPQEVAEKLALNGYRFRSLVSDSGEFSQRGGILDIYPASAQAPVRIEFWGDEVLSIREFDPDTQRSLRELQEVTIFPSSEVVLPEGEYSTGNTGDQASFSVDGTDTLFDYLPADTILFFDDQAKIKEAASSYEEELGSLAEAHAGLKHGVFDKGGLYCGSNEIFKIRRDFDCVFIGGISRRIPDASPTNVVELSSKDAPRFLGQRQAFVSELKRLRKGGHIIIVLASTKDTMDRMTEELLAEGIGVSRTEILRKMPLPGIVHICLGRLNNGFSFDKARVIILSDSDVFGRAMRRRVRPATRRRTAQAALATFEDLKPGDYVVHVNHGIAKYMGLKTVRAAGNEKEYLFLQYAGEDVLYVPTDQMDRIQKYVGSEGHEPRVSRLGGNEWGKTKKKVKQAVTEMAQSLLRLYSARQDVKGHTFGEDTAWQREFEDSFDYQDTPDQAQATLEIKADMERPKPMDRLLCGDVGYGKTEVALRAAFKAVTDGKQVAVLVPTTILAEQHYSTFRQRLEGYPIKVEVLSRFKTPAQQEKTIRTLASGNTDIIIGTHRLLQADVTFRDLGLLIVDEEHRFGVAHKERIKELKKDVDVLTLSATPIPRTLHMALTGIRDISVMETPPEDRFPVQTYVVEHTDRVIYEAISREMSRGGQVFYVYNRVETIGHARESLNRLFPRARIAVAHGQMKEDELERVMLDFLERKYDILVTTTIIESGLDIANANTLIVEDADRLGLAQLYQLRGRVGRSNRLAYAYFTYRPEKILKEAAEKRLKAIEEFTELGSGFKLALRDLEIRGSGNLLGPQQHGFIASVGFELYTQMLSEAIRELRGEVPDEAARPQAAIEIGVDAYMPSDYIPDSSQRMEMYRRLAMALEVSEIQDIEEELKDRFGRYPEPVANLLKVATARCYANKLGIASVSETGRREGLRDYHGVTFKWIGSPPPPMELLARLGQDFRRRVMLLPGKKKEILIKIPRPTTRTCVHRVSETKRQSQAAGYTKGRHKVDQGAMGSEGTTCIRDGSFLLDSVLNIMEILSSGKDHSHHMLGKSRSAGFDR